MVLVNYNGLSLLGIAAFLSLRISRLDIFSRMYLLDDDDPPLCRAAASTIFGQILPTECSPNERLPSNSCSRLEKEGRFRISSQQVALPYTARTDGQGSGPCFGLALSVVHKKPQTCVWADLNLHIP